MIDVILEFDQVAFWYTRRGRRLPVFHDLSVKVPHGRRVAIVGRSGAGKSTLLDVASGVRNASSGRVVLDGSVISEMSDDARADVRLATVGYVRQGFDLLDSLSALDNVAMALQLRGSSRPDARASARKVLEELDLGHRLEHRPRELSGGEKQRVALARAIVHSPELILADEPTGSLDRELRDEALDVMLTTCAGRAMLVVTHDPSVAERVADEIWVMSPRGALQRQS